jgi:hypothetical protein
MNGEVLLLCDRLVCKYQSSMLRSIYLQLSNKDCTFFFKAPCAADIPSNTKWLLEFKCRLLDVVMDTVELTELPSRMLRNVSFLDNIYAPSCLALI